MFKNHIQNPLLRGLAEWLLAILLAVLLFFVVRSFLFRVAHVTGNSMESTLSHGDMVILNRLSYLFFNPRIGDIIAFPNPENNGEFFIKRIIAGPGDIVDLLDGFFVINGIPLEDNFSANPTSLLGNVSFPIEIEEGRYFVLGDNRNNSLDSRSADVGNIQARDMVGRVAIRVFPFDRFGRVE